MAAQDLPTLASELRRLRLEAGLSQEALADRAGLSSDAIAALERGRRRVPRQSTLQLLADALSLDPSQRALLNTISRSSSTSLKESSPVGVAPEHRPRINADPLVGREAARKEVVDLLRQSRLVTLTGPAGVGKTRLALAVAGDVQPDFADGACWVSLVAARDSTALVSTVTTALGMREEPGCDQLESLCHHLASRQLLLVLDHADQVVAECAALCRSLMALTHVHILVTSRELLRASGETVWTVAPLAVPDHVYPPDRLEAFASVQLFVQLARARSPQFVLTAENAPAVAEICARLEGLPLAIELAAARTNVFTVQEIAAELDEGLGLLSTATRKWSARHRTLQRAIDWSYERLSRSEQALFARLSVFAGGWTLVAAEAVTSRGNQPLDDVVDLTSRLVDKSLIAMRDRRGRARFYMLGPLRQYAVGVLEESGELENARRSHALFFLDLAELAEAGIRGPHQQEALNQLEDEVDNLRAALAWSTSVGDGELGLRLAGSLMMFWYLHGRYSEGREWLDLALQTGIRAPSKWRAKGLLASGTLASLQCDYDLAAARTASALEQFEALGNQTGVSSALDRLGSLAREQGRYAEAEGLHRETLARRRGLGDEAGVAASLNFLGFVAWLRGDLVAATGHCSAALELFRRIGDREGVAWSLISLGSAAAYAGDLDLAAARLEEALAVSRSLGFTEGIAWSLSQLALVARRRGADQVAWDLGRQGLSLHRRLGDRWRAASVLEELAATAVARSEPRTAATLAGAALGVRHAIGTPVPACEVADHDSTVAAIGASVPREALAADLGTGRRTPVDRIDAILDAADRRTSLDRFHGR